MDKKNLWQLFAVEGNKLTLKQTRFINRCFILSHTRKDKSSVTIWIRSTRL